MNKLNSLLANIVASFFIWASVGMVGLLTSPGDGMRGFAILVAIGTTAALWLIWALDSLSSNRHEPQEKAKRSTSSEDARLALLLELLGEEERQALKERLLTDLQSDGEAYSLADLLEVQESRSKR